MDRDGECQNTALKHLGRSSKLECGTDICRACTLEKGSLWKWKVAWALCALRETVLDTELEGDQWQTCAAGEAPVRSESV